MTTADRRCVFLDRDGTLIEDTGYIRDPRHVSLLPGVVEGLRRLKEQGWLCVVISNQSGIGRGLMTADEAQQVHREVIATLAGHGIELDAAHYCPHRPEDGCACRKPSPDMLLRAAEALHIDLARSYMIGDKACDIEAGKRAGCRTIFLTAGRKHIRCSPPPDMTADSWSEILDHLLGPAGMRL